MDPINSGLNSGSRLFVYSVTSAIYMALLNIGLSGIRVAASMHKLGLRFLPVLNHEYKLYAVAEFLLTPISPPPNLCINVLCIELLKVEVYI